MYLIKKSGESDEEDVVLLIDEEVSEKTKLFKFDHIAIESNSCLILLSKFKPMIASNIFPFKLLTVCGDLNQSDLIKKDYRNFFILENEDNIDDIIEDEQNTSEIVVQDYSGHIPRISMSIG